MIILDWLTCILVIRPAGWDNDKKINILYENLTSMKPDDDYSDVITRPATRSVVGGVGGSKAASSAGRDVTETHAEDEQSFLSRLLQQLQQQQPMQTAGGMTTGAVNGSMGTASPVGPSTGNSPAVNSTGGTPVRSAQIQKPTDRRSSSTIPNQVSACFIILILKLLVQEQSFDFYLDGCFQERNQRHIGRSFSQFFQFSVEKVLGDCSSSWFTSFRR